MSDFITTYGQDFVKKRIEKVEPCAKFQQFKDPISEGFKHYLTLEDEKLPEPIEPVDEFFKTFQEKNKKINEIYFKTPIDKQCILEKFKIDGQTIYKIDYCKMDQNIIEKERLIKERKVKLPDDVYIPHSTQKNDYRNPSSLVENAFVPPSERIIKPSSELDAHKIIKIRPDVTTYQEYHGKLGGFIIEKEIYGTIRKS